MICIFLFVFLYEVVSQFKKKLGWKKGKKVRETGFGGNGVKDTQIKKKLIIPWKILEEF